MTTQEEYAERRERWAQALESGKYAQTKGQLRGRDGYCCLGVACDLYAKENRIRWGHYKGDYKFLKKSGALPREVIDWLGIATSTGEHKSRAHTDSLTGRNDEGDSFQEIAAIIRSAPEGLFDDA